LRALIFDMDGVLTDTAVAHFTAWKEVFDAVLEEHGKAEFTRRDYLDLVDGVPRYDGVRNLLASRSIPLPEGEPDDEGLSSVRGIGNAKNRRYHEWLERNPVPVFEDAKALMACARRDGLQLAVYSASRNAERVLRSAGLHGSFDVTVDGRVVEDLGLEPKPDPGQLLETASRLRCRPEDAVVLEDALSGVAAASAGRFGFTVGVNRQDEDRTAQRHALRAAGADIVTADLRQLTLPDRSGLRRLNRLPSVWDRAPEISERLDGENFSVFLDYDGTLSPIVDDYREATVPAETVEAVRRLSRTCPVAVISGRDLSDVRDRVGIQNVVYAGSHGFDIAGPDMQERPEEAERFLEPIARVADELREAVSDIPGAEVEQKTFSVAIHFRQVQPHDVERLDQRVAETVRRHEVLRRSRGKKVIEVQPVADWDKGRAVEWLLAHTALGEGRRFPLYVGDDLTDEDAFSALSEHGIGIVVRGGVRFTLADYALEDPQDVRRFLLWLSDREAQA